MNFAKNCPIFVTFANQKSQFTDFSNVFIIDITFSNAILIEIANHIKTTGCFLKLKKKKKNQLKFSSNCIIHQQNYSYSWFSDFPEFLSFHRIWNFSKSGLRIFNFYQNLRFFPEFFFYRIRIFLRIRIIQNLRFSTEFLIDFRIFFRIYFYLRFFPKFLFIEFGFFSG